MIEERLLIRLRERANMRGIVPVRGDALAQEVEASQEVVGAALNKLARAGLVDILAPFPFLVVKLRKWSGEGKKLGDSASSAYSSSKQLFHSQHVKAGYRPDGERVEPAGDLLREILETLGETDAASFEKAVELYSPHVIRTALDRVRRARSIRKSRTALFRHLLPRLASSDQDPD
jgi:DNA-binding GntR family transcriptional regulator